MSSAQQQVFSQDQLLLPATADIHSFRVQHNKPPCNQRKKLQHKRAMTSLGKRVLQVLKMAREYCIELACLIETFVWHKLLLLLSVNDFTNCLPYCSRILHADDTTIFNSDNSITSLKLNWLGGAVITCYKFMRLRQHLSSSLHCKNLYLLVPPIKIALNNIPLGNCSRLLDVQLDGNLKCHQHIAYIWGKKNDARPLSSISIPQHWCHGPFLSSTHTFLTASFHGVTHTPLILLPVRQSKTK